MLRDGESQALEGEGETAGKVRENQSAVTTTPPLSSSGSVFPSGPRDLPREEGSQAGFSAHLEARP